MAARISAGVRKSVSTLRFGGARKDRPLADGLNVGQGLGDAGASPLGRVHDSLATQEGTNIGRTEKW
jgi:hypothetical protein